VSGDGYVERCERAADQLLNLSETRPTVDGVRLRGKAQGIHLALSYLRDYPTPAAARLRSLAATFDSHLNRDKTYTGAQVAAMLRDGEG